MSPFRNYATPEDQRLMSELVLRYIHDGVIILDAACNVALINPAASTLLNISSDNALHLHYSSIIHLIDKQGSPIQPNFCPIASAINQRQNIETTEFKLVPIGTNRNIPVHIIVTPTSDGQLYIITISDITKEITENADRNEFISTASHEMRTPVASIEGYLALAMNPQTATIDARAAGYLAKAHEASQHLGRLFQDLLDTTQLDDGHAKIHLQPVDLAATVKSITDASLPRIQAKGLQYVFNSPAAGQINGQHQLGQLIYADIDLNYLREILDNIIDNAIKYTPAGSITVDLRADPEKAVIIITDTGIGIPAAELPHIFQKFYRVDTSDTREIGGTGLGLYITKQRVSAMHGHIWADSQPGRGTSFYISFPRLSSTDYEKRRLAEQSNQIFANQP